MRDNVYRPFSGQRLKEEVASCVIFSAQTGNGVRFGSSKRLGNNVLLVLLF